MQERSRKKTTSRDINVIAANIVAQSTSQDIPKTNDGKNAYAVALGRAGGLKGGRVRAEKLTSARRSEIAKKAANTRWGNGALREMGRPTN
ncbi:hypothetical protein ACFLVS_05840 [Chloroflexota bacterium]